MDQGTAALAVAISLGLIALVHLALAWGLRRGELVWSGRQPRLLAPDLRLRSALVALLLLLSAWTLAEATGLTSGPIPELYVQSATFMVTAFLTTYFLYSLIWGSRWERMIFAPVMLAGAGVAGWLTFL